MAHLPLLIIKAIHRDQHGRDLRATMTLVPLQIVFGMAPE